jgi:hypothetical protein
MPPDSSGAARHTQGHHTAVLHVGGAREHLEVHVGHHVGDFGELQVHPQVGLVRAVEVHGFLVGHHREFAQIHADGVLEHRRDHALEQRADLFLTQERGLDIDLRELGLAVGAQILVAEALGDLVVAVKARHHQQLLEQLGDWGKAKKWPSCTRLGTR